MSKLRQWFLTKLVWVIVALMCLMIVVGAFVRLSIAHADTTSLANFLTAALIPGIPAAAAWFNSRRAKDHALESQETARRVEINTNGKMDVKFAGIQRDLTDLKSTFERHLEYHAMEEKE
jgi:hypothetical protein